MGAPKQRWTPEEEEALRSGVLKHGAGKWRLILKDPQFGRRLFSRSNVDLKDKWRNMCGSYGSQEKGKLPRINDTPATSVTRACSHSSAPSEQDDQTPVTGYSDNVQDAKTSTEFTTMITEALSNLREPHGSEISAICGFIEQRHNVPPNFRRILGSKLKLLAVQEKVEKVKRGYKLKQASTPFETKTPITEQRDPANCPMFPGSPVRNGADILPVGPTMTAVTHIIAEAEAKSFLASEAVEEVERILRLAEESDSLLTLASEILEQCSQGEIMIIIQPLLLSGETPTEID
ncbi:unnamed protein product [Spirodela intermedia]|uniref:Uncharacterized protein n=1 Tax=Spirodela intermedia TaxID=51605 RepID=A0A7I8LK24_SPIIN|nr:unnamed protein product [Spirodela intermedia]